MKNNVGITRRSCGWLRRGSSGGRKYDREDGSAADLTLDFDAAAMRVNDMFGDRQAEPGPPQLPRTCRIHAVETLEDPFQFRLGNADAGIFYGDNRLRTNARDADGHSPSLRGVAYGVVENILDDLLERSK